MIRRLTVIAILLVLLGLLLAACGEDEAVQSPENSAGSPVVPTVPPSQAPEQLGLAGTDWVLLAINGGPFESALPYTLQFDGNGVSGKAGCMVYSSMIEARPGATLSQQRIFSHIEQCNSGKTGIAEAEVYIEVLDQATHYVATENHLQFMNEQGETTLEFRPGYGDGELDGTAWVLTSLNGKQPATATDVTLTFTGDNVSGNGGCNGYGGTYMLPDLGTIVIAGVGRTEEGCVDPPGVMEQETEFKKSLTRVATYQVSEDSLELLDASGKTILVLDAILANNALYKTHWSLISIGGSPLVQDSMVQIRFGARAAGGYDSCSMYYSNYGGADDGSLIFSNFGPQETACPNDVSEIADQRAAYMSALSEVATYHLDGPSLELLDAADEPVLVFELVP